MPALGRHLRVDDGGGPIVAVLEDLEEVAQFAVLHRREQEIVEHRYLDSREASEERGVCTIGAGDRKIVDDPCDPGIEGTTALTAGGMNEIVLVHDGGFRVDLDFPDPTMALTRTTRRPGRRVHRRLPES